MRLLISRRDLLLGAVRQMRTSLRLSHAHGLSGREEAVPLAQSGGAVQLEVGAGLEASLSVEQVVDRGMDGGELLQASHPPVAQHRLLPPSEWQVRVLSAVVRPTASFPPAADTEIPQDSAIGPKPVGHHRVGRTMPLQCFPHKFQSAVIVSGPGDEAFQNLALMIDRTPEVVALPNCLHEHLVQMPATVPAAAHPVNPPPPELGPEHPPEPVLPEPHGLTADIDAAFVQQVLDVSQGQRKPHIHLHRQADDLGTDLKVAEGGLGIWPDALRTNCLHLRAGSSERAVCIDGGRSVRPAAVSPRPALGSGRPWPA